MLWRPAILAAAALALAEGACAHRVPADARTVVVSLTGMDCADCGPPVVAQVRKEPGVHAVSFDKRRAEITARVAPGFDDRRLLAAVERAGFRGEIGAGKGAYIPMPAFPPDADVVTVARDGADVPDLAPHAVAGKITVFDFYADWCDPCRKADEHMQAVLAAQKDVAYRKLDVGDWDTPLGKRYLGDVPELPYLVVYDASGRRVAAVAGLRLADIDAAIGRARSAPR